MGFKEDVAAARSKPPASLIVPIHVNGTRYELKFTRMPAAEYAREIQLHAPRMDTDFGRSMGYDILTLSRAVAPRCAVLLDGEEEETLTEEQWADLFLALDGGAHEQIANTVFQLNEFVAAEAMSAARKVLSGAALNSVLRSASESLPAVSKGGNRPSSTSTSTKKTA